MTTINRATWIDDDGTGTKGTIINNARLQQDIYDKIDAALAALDAADAALSAAAPKAHTLLSATHTDATPAAAVAGDLIIAAGAPPKFARLPVGGAGQVLTVAAGAPAWQAPAGGGSGSPHAVLSTTHTDALPATLVAGDVLIVNASGQLTRLAIGAAGQLLSVVGGLAAWAAAPATPAHNILSATHGDTIAAALVAGDLLYVDATGKLTRLPKGTAAQVLTMGATLPGWAAAAGGGANMGAKVWNNAGQAIAATTYVTLTWTTADFDYGPFWSSGTRLTVPAGQAGLYQVYATVAASAAANLRARLLRNNAVCSTEMRTYNVGVPGGVNTGSILNLAAGDYMEIQAFASAAVTIGGATRDQSVEFSMWKIG
jgi:hypothetical protein